MPKIKLFYWHMFWNALILARSKFVVSYDYKYLKNLKFFFTRKMKKDRVFERIYFTKFLNIFGQCQKIKFFL